MEKLDLTALELALDSLQAAVGDARDEAFISGLSESQKRLIRAGVIQNFEFTYELTFKMLKRQLEQDAASPAEVDQYSFRDLLRTAAVRGLIENVEDWFEYRRYRNITSHTYDPQKAEQVFNAALAFAGDAAKVLQRLQVINATP
ncbi:HI0074 family nucleotidyltransferase substrate-binding subunit [Aliamphritea hakodatensis]|uniref:HI0074 family nucleotidyltransferase substrate-binding subunit n=1 Tax=Aliamphritea hakodatensis TaxID=2895352 RepID=UPI0022FD38EE|nr:HI0074 family nucleotidyltransferase substrate-binding subunit [Aliamphritea hakodatensis]